MADARDCPGKVFLEERRSSREEKCKGSESTEKFARGKLPV